SGRRPVSTRAKDAALVAEVEANPHQSASSIKVNARFPGSSRTVIRRLRDVRRYPRVAATKGCITDDHRLFRLAFAEENVNFDWNKFAKEYENKGEDWQEKALFSDVSKFNVFGSDGRQMVWRKPKEEMKTKNLRATVKHGRGNVMIWGCVSASEVGELLFIEYIMKKEDYLHFLQHNLVKSAEKLEIEKEFMFYQNNDPKHNSHIVQEFLLYKCVKCFILLHNRRI
ncbi:hypothetical protein ANN_14092, partial [Periplaneta americana]